MYAYISAGASGGEAQATFEDAVRASSRGYPHSHTPPPPPTAAAGGGHGRAHDSRGGGGDVPRGGVAGAGGSGEGGGEASSQSISMRSTVMADQSAAAVGEVLDLFALLVQKYECCTHAVAVGEVLSICLLYWYKSANAD
jgi:hypothetical protein